MVFVEKQLGQRLLFTRSLATVATTHEQESLTSLLTARSLASGSSPCLPPNTHQTVTKLGQAINIPYSTCATATAPPMFVVVLMSMMMMLSGITMVDARCRAPLTLMLTAQAYWETWIGNTFYDGPFDGDATLEPYSSYERVMNITVYVERSMIALSVRVVSAGPTSLMASVSFNGVKLATTGDTVSRWIYTTDYDEIYGWWNAGNPTNVSLWKPVNTSAICNLSTMPSTNRDGRSFSEFISANGVTPARDSTQFGGDSARWIGINENNGDCSVASHVVYRMTLDLTALADEPICFAEDDGRALLSPQTPIIGIPNIGLKTLTSQVITFVGSVEGFFEVWVDGLGAEGRRGYFGDTVEYWASLTHMEFNIEPERTSLLAIYVRPAASDQMFIANILYNGQLFAASDSLAQWKVFASDMEPEFGWNTDPKFDDSAWTSMSDSVLCKPPIFMSEIRPFLNKTYGGCANWLWHLGCRAYTHRTPLYVRIPLDFVDSKKRPALECSMHSLDNTIKKLPPVPDWTPSDHEIIAIASSAILGSFMMIAAYLFVRRYLSRRSKTNMLSSVSTTTKTSSMTPSSSPKKWSMWSTTRHETTSHSSMIHLAYLSGVDVNLRPRLMGELEKSSNVLADDRSGSIARTAVLHMDHDVISLSKLIKAYQSKQRSAGVNNFQLQPSAPSETRTMTHGTRTEFTLVDGATQSLELPGFLQLKEGIDYNLFDEYAAGGGGSLFSGRMFARGLPNLNVIVKRMTNASLQAFRQEVALMWLFNDNENMVKIMGFNETQLAIVMPEYELGSLKRLIDTGDYDSKVARSLLLDIAKGLFTMHERGVVHQDIKPDNVLLEPHPTRRVRALITDFGISNVVEDKVLTVKAFEVKNKSGLTIAYAAPEAIVRFRNKDLSRVPAGEAKAGDVYSFAIVIHTLLAHLRRP